ncbi:MAG: hypothetical protein R2713_22670 [Ilumatobacteraceae bacterium]
MIAPATGTYEFTTQGSQLDTVLAVYRGPATGADPATMPSIGCNDDSNRQPWSSVSVQATAGDILYVQVGGSRAAPVW